MHCLHDATSDTSTLDNMTDKMSGLRARLFAKRLSEICRCALEIPMVFSHFLMSVNLWFPIFGKVD